MEDPADPGTDPDPAAADPVQSPSPTPSRRWSREPRLYAGTAGHCVSGVGARVSTDDGPFGTVAFSVLTEDGDAFDDVAFVEIDRDKENLVNPEDARLQRPDGGYLRHEARAW